MLVFTTLARGEGLYVQHLGVWPRLWEGPVGFCHVAALAFTTLAAAPMERVLVFTTLGRLAPPRGALGILPCGGVDIYHTASAPMGWVLVFVALGRLALPRESPGVQPCGVMVFITLASAPTEVLVFTALERLDPPRGSPRSSVMWRCL